MQKLTKARLEQILRKALKLHTAAFLLEKSGQRIFGSIISEKFKGKRDLARQEMIWDALEKALGAEAVLRVGMLLAYTPDEWEMGERVAAKLTRAMAS